MQQPNTILQPNNGLNLSTRTGLTANDASVTLRLAETESRLNQVFEEYTGRIDAMMSLLDMVTDAVIMVNQTGEICYTNHAGNQLLQGYDGQRPEYLYYRDIAEEKIISAAAGVSVQVNHLEWSGEQCNVFIIKTTTALVNEASNTGEQVNTPAAANELKNYVKLMAVHETAGRHEAAAACAALVNQTISEGQKLTDSIKAFTGLAAYTPVLTAVSMQKIAGDILKAMGPEIEDAGIEITISDLPETNGDKALISMLLKNLISNAVKFRNKARKPIIDIGHDRVEGQYIFCVRDNGIGISKKNHEEIFEPFTMLNDANEYPGNGMGLAVCKKIVELHGGRIWVESLPGHGSNFYFKLTPRQ